MDPTDGGMAPAFGGPMDTIDPRSSKGFASDLSPDGAEIRYPGPSLRSTTDGVQQGVNPGVGAQLRVERTGDDVVLANQDRVPFDSSQNLYLRP